MPPPAPPPARSPWVSIVLASVVGLFLFAALLLLTGGAAVAIGNLWLVGRVVRGFVSGTAQALWGFVAALKFTLLVVLLWVLLKSGLVDLLPLVIGYGALPLGIFASQLGGASPARERG